MGYVILNSTNVLAILVIIFRLLKKEILMPNDKTKITKEMLEKAMECDTAEDLIELCKKAGITITKEEAVAYHAELADFELNSKALDKVAGGEGNCYMDCPNFVLPPI